MQLAYAKSNVNNTGSLGTTQAIVEINPTIMHVLSRDLYQRPVEAVFRETITNALDSHVEAGTEHVPVDILLPTIFSEDFYIRDYGTGLSLERVKELYLSYGRSTRRDSDDYTGAFGLGCKASLAYTTAFSVTSFFEGQKHSFLVYYDQDNIPCLDHRSSEPTNEPNGLKISFSILRMQDATVFQDAAKKVLSRIPRDKFRIVNTDLELGESFFSLPDAKQYGQLVLRERTESTGFIRVVMGYIAYDVPVHDFLSNAEAAFGADYRLNWEYTLQDGVLVRIEFYKAVHYLVEVYNVEVHLPLGGVSIHPSRENVILTVRTMQVLIDAIKNGLNEYISSNQDTAPVLRDNFIYRVTGQVPVIENDSVLAKIVFKYPHSSYYLNISSYIYNYGSQFFAELRRTMSYNQPLYVCGLNKDVMQRLFGNNDRRDHAISSYIDGKVVIFYAKNVNADVSSRLFSGLPTLAEDEITALAPLVPYRSEISPNARSTRSLRDPKHNVLILDNGFGYFKSNWVSQQHTVESLRAINRPIFWVSTKMGCVKTQDINAIIRSYTTVMRIIPERIRPIIIGLPATKGTLTIQRAFSNIQELPEHVKNTLSHDYFMRRLRIYATVKALSLRNESFLKAIRYWNSADLCWRYINIVEKHSLGGYISVASYLDLKLDDLVNTKIVDYFKDACIKFPHVAYYIFDVYQPQLYVNWAINMAKLLNEEPTSAMYKNRGYA